VGVECRPRTRHPDHLGTQIGQHHRAERPRADAGHFNDLESSKRSSHVHAPESAPTGASIQKIMSTPGYAGIVETDESTAHERRQLRAFPLQLNNVKTFTFTGHDRDYR
jgi:hypothetical protein